MPDDHHARASRSLDIPRYCPACRYDLRGTTEGAPCPECGNDDFSPRRSISVNDAARVTIVIETACTSCGGEFRADDDDDDACALCNKNRRAAIIVGDGPTFFRTRAALDDAGMVLEHREFGGTLGTLGTFALGRQGTGTLIIARRDLKRASEFLESHGILLPLDVRPIVDRSEPACPSCGEEVDPHGEPRCAICGTDFDWVEIDEREFDGAYDPAPRECPMCGREAQADALGCEKCGAMIGDSRLTTARLAVLSIRTFGYCCMIAAFLVFLFDDLGLALILAAVGLILFVMSSGISNAPDDSPPTMRHDDDG